MQFLLPLSLSLSFSLDVFLKMATLPDKKIIKVLFDINLIAYFISSLQVLFIFWLSKVLLNLFDSLLALLATTSRKTFEHATVWIRLFFLGRNLSFVAYYSLQNTLFHFVWITMQKLYRMDVYSPTVSFSWKQFYWYELNDYLSHDKDV